MKKLEISINPTYQCNFNCDFCYLKGLDNSKIMDLNILEVQLEKLSTQYLITNIDIYGGEIFLLSDEYLEKLIIICKKYIKVISIITNFSIIKEKFLNRSDLNISISWDYIFRKENCLKNLKYIKNKETTIILTHPNLYQYKNKILKILNSLENININLKPYYKTFNTKLQINFKDFQKFYLYLFFNCKHKVLLDINKNISEHIFISPMNKIEEIKYKNNEEYFNENLITKNNIECLTCQFYNNCLKEHEYMKTNYDCCGQFKLLTKLKELNFDNTSWKERRIKYYKIGKFTDQNLQYIYNNNIIDTCIEFFKSGSKLIYPAKSYYVAIIYAYGLSEYFGEDFYEMLNRDDLLNYDDPYFIPYLKDKHTYDKILNNISINLSIIQDTFKYFKEEFLININNNLIKGF